MSSGATSWALFKLLADVTGPGPVWAKKCNIQGEILDETWGQVYNWEALLDNAGAGYIGLFVLVDTLWVLDNGPCIPERDVGEGAITPGDPPEGTVGSAYTFTVDGAALSTDMAATGLPPGLSIAGSTGVISGTPTEAGTFGVVVTAETESGDGGTITTAFQIGIVEES